MSTHKQLIQLIADLENQDSSIGDSQSWSTGEPFINFLYNNDLSSRFALLITTKKQFVHTLVVDNSMLDPINPDDLINWSVSIPQAAAGYCYVFGDSESVKISTEIDDTRTYTLENSTPIVFARYFDGILGPNKVYYEINQEIIHASELHWMHEKKAYCKIDRLGDIVEEINITQTQITQSDLSLITSEPDILEDFLIATKSSLVRLYLFDISHQDGINDSNLPKERVVITDIPGLFYERYKIDEMSFLRGVQIIRPHNPHDFILKRIMGEKQIEQKYVEFIAVDLRDKHIKKISTDPKATCNYFNSNATDKPLELSPAFFRQEVLSKYKNDPDKYTLSNRQLYCRNAWTLRDIDFNNSGQIHAYICDLADIPYEEQLYWLSYNEEPKSGMSERAIRNDFFAQWYSNDRPIDQIKTTLRRWESEKVGWWQRNISAEYPGFDYPLSDNKQEWAKHFLELAKLVVEGFKLKYSKSILAQKSINIPEDKKSQSITILEMVLTAVSSATDPVSLISIREVQRLRTKLTAHISGNEAMAITQNALNEFETFENHFQNICENVYQELLLIESILKESDLSE